MADMTPYEQDVLRAVQDGPPWWPGANPTALRAVMHGSGTLRGRSLESIRRSLLALERKGVLYRDTNGWHQGRAPALDEEQPR